MTTTAMTTMTATVLHSFAYGLDYLREQVADVAPADMVAQPNGIMNHPWWVIGHLTCTCQLLGGVVGLRPWLPDGWAKRFGTGSVPVADATMYDSRETALALLRDAQSRLTQAVQQLDDARLDTPFPDESYRDVFPTIRHAATQVLVGHTALHVGQLSVWRKAMGLPRIAPRLSDAPRPGFHQPAAHRNKPTTGSPHHVRKSARRRFSRRLRRWSTRTNVGSLDDSWALTARTLSQPDSPNSASTPAYFLRTPSAFRPPRTRSARTRTPLRGKILQLHGLCIISPEYQRSSRAAADGNQFPGFGFGFSSFTQRTTTRRPRAAGGLRAFFQMRSFPMSTVRQEAIRAIACAKHNLNRVDFKKTHVKDLFGVNVFNEEVQQASACPSRSSRPCRRRSSTACRSTPPSPTPSPAP